MSNGNPYSHFYLYFKNWYIQSENRMYDLSRILSDYSGTPVEYVSERDVQTVLLEIAHYEIVEKKSFDFIHFVNLCSERGVIGACGIVLAVAPSGDSDRLPLYKPNPNILPITRENQKSMRELPFKWATED